MPSLPEINCNIVFPDHCYVQDDKLYTGSWKTSILRFFVPSYASIQDLKATDFFVQFFKELFEKQMQPADKEKALQMLSLAEQHIARGNGWFSSQSEATSQLERYSLAVRQKLHLFDQNHLRESFLAKCRINNRALLDKWSKLGFSEEAFWSSPDLVDFVFHSFLHRHITHPYYKHTIHMLPVFIWQEGQIAIENHPHLLVDGIATPWAEVRKKIKLDKNGRLFSIENALKKYWMYLDEGLTQWDRNNFNTPRRLFKLDRPPMRSRVEIITTHAHKKDWHLGDRLLKGTRHSFFRIVPGEETENSVLEKGSVYSMGWGAKWRDFSFFGPLSTLQGTWFCPDHFEFLKEDLCITPVDVAEEQVCKLLEVVKQRNKEAYPFNVITSNCCGMTVDVLKEAGIVTLCTKNHMAYMWYKFFLPKYIRMPLDQIGEFIGSMTPHFMAQGIHFLGSLMYSIVFAPIFTLLGAWRTTLSFEDETVSGHESNLIRVMASNRIKALFSNVFDLFCPSKMEFDLTKNIYKWQKHLPQTYFEKRD